MKNTVHNMKWAAKIKIAKLQKVKSAKRAEPKPQNPVDIGMSKQSTKANPTYY